MIKIGAIYSRIQRSPPCIRCRARSQLKVLKKSKTIGIYDYKCMNCKREGKIWEGYIDENTAIMSTIQNRFIALMKE